MKNDPVELGEDINYCPNCGEEMVTYIKSRGVWETKCPNNCNSEDEN